MSNPENQQEIPQNLPEELLPVYEWYKKQGPSTLVIVAIVVVIVAGSMIFSRYRVGRNAEASSALLTATTSSSLEDVLSRFGGTQSAPVMKLRLGKTYYNEGNYAAAFETFDAFFRANRSNEELAPIAAIGRAASLEALARFSEAREAFALIGKKYAESFVAPAAVLGEARCLAAEGDKSAAKDLLERFIVENAGSDWESRAKNLQGVIDRFDGFKTASLFDRLGELRGVEEAAPAAEAPAAAEIAPAAEEAAPAAEAPAAADAE